MYHIFIQVLRCCLGPCIFQEDTPQPPDPNRGQSRVQAPDLTAGTPSLPGGSPGSELCRPPEPRWVLAQMGQFLRTAGANKTQD